MVFPVARKSFLLEAWLKISGVQLVHPHKFLEPGLGVDVVDTGCLRRV